MKNGGYLFTFHYRKANSHSSFYILHSSFRTFFIYLDSPKSVEVAVFACCNLFCVSMEDGYWLVARL